MNLGRLFWNWDPWREFGALSGRDRRWGQRPTYPPVNVYEASDAYGLEVEVPGVDPEKLDVTVEGDLVTVSGERVGGGSEAGAHRQERPVGRFSRMLRMPARLEAESVEAHYVDGVLTVKLPKAPEAKARRISVKGN